MKSLTTALACLSISLLLCGPASAQQSPQQLHEMTAEKFSTLPAADEPIDFDHVDLALLDAAVFHETNRQRVQEKLPALSYHAALREVARVQSRGMILQQEVTHTHPDEDLKTMSDRMKSLEITGRYFAENVAMVFGIRYQSGNNVYPRLVEGKRVYAREPDGTAIAPHTYRTFANNLVGEWMASPGHRKNILASDPRFLGVSCLHDRAALGMDRFYCTQEFLAPFPD